MRHETQMRQLICFSFAKEYGQNMERQLIIERWWVWRLFHSLYNICEEYYWLKKSKCVKKGEICWFVAERSCKVIYWIFVQKGSDREHLNFMNNKIDTLIRNALDAHDYETALKRLSLSCFNWLKESIAV